MNDAEKDVVVGKKTIGDVEHDIRIADLSDPFQRVLVLYIRGANKVRETSSSLMGALIARMTGQ